jgi:hypothetical protein
MISVSCVILQIFKKNNIFSPSIDKGGSGAAIGAMSGSSFVLVLDLNGILVDVRRKEATPVVDRRPDVILPNGQKAYMHPHCLKFLHAITMLENVRVVLYTSRLKHNSEPIERLLAPYISKVAITLHGEDCESPGYAVGGVDRFHPIKTSRAVSDALGVGDCPAGDITMIFLDDNIHRIRLNGPSTMRSIKTLKVGTYDASKSSITDIFLEKAWHDLQDEMRHST